MTFATNRAASAHDLLADGLRLDLHPQGALEELIFAHLLITAAALRQIDAVGSEASFTERDRTARAFFRAVRELRAIQRNRPEPADEKNIKLGNEPDKSLKTREAVASDPEPEAEQHTRAEEPPRVLPFRRPAPKVGRNEPCPCGSAMKFKRCCGG